MIDQSDPSSSLLGERRSVDIFVCTVVISLILHIAVTALLTLPGRFTAPPAPPVFLDLQNIYSLPDPDEKPLDEQSQAVDPLPPNTQPVPEISPEVAEFDKRIEHSLRKALQSPEAIHETSIGLGMISGHFASFAEGESLKDDIRVYYFTLMRRINEVWWVSGAAKGTFTSAASVNIHISREGKVLGCDLIESSGSSEQDLALLDSIKKAEPLPPLPRSFYGRVFNAPIRFVPPLRLMLPGIAKKKVNPH